MQIKYLKIRQNELGILFRDREFKRILEPGRYLFLSPLWRVRVDIASVRAPWFDHEALEVIAKSGALEGKAEVVDLEQHERALREVVGARELDALLTEREAVAAELTGELRQRAKGFGVKVESLGIRDIILPGDMKELMNKVTEARKAAEAALLTRREETAAMRSQANTARILDSNPTLMRLRELEVLEKVAANTQLSVVLGEAGLADRVLKLL